MEVVIKKTFSSISKKRAAFLGTLAIFLLLLNSSTIYSYYFGTLSTLFLILGGLCSLLLFVLVKPRVHNYSIKLSLIFLLMVTFVGIVTSFNASVLFYLLKYLCVFLVAVSFMDMNISLTKQLFTICKIFVFWALICYLLFNVLSVTFLPVTNAYPTEWGTYKSLYLFFLMKNEWGQITILGITITRLHVPFSEPGVAQLVFNYALFYLLFFDNRRFKYKKLLMFFAITIGIVLTISLIGYAIYAALVFIYLLKKKHYFVIALFIVFAAIVVGSAVSEKLSSASYVDRINDYTFIFETTLDNLPFGIGLGNSDTLVRINEATGEEWTYSMFSGLFTPLVYFGLLSVVFYYVLFISIKYVSITKNRYNSLAICALIVLTLLTEPLTFTTFFAVFLANGIVNKAEYLRRVNICLSLKRKEVLA